MRDQHAVAARGLNCQFVDALGLWIATAEIAGRVRTCGILYSPLHPLTPPLLWEIDPTTIISDDWETHHQLANGSLCLFTMGHGESSWHRDLTIADVVERWIEFRRRAASGEHAAEFFSGDDPIGRRRLERACYIDPCALLKLGRRAGRHGALAWHGLPTSRLLIAGEARTQTHKALIDAGASWASVRPGSVVEGHWLTVASDVMPSGLDDFIAWLRVHGSKRLARAFELGEPLLVIPVGAREKSVLVRRSQAYSSRPYIQRDALHSLTLEEATMRRIGDLIDTDRVADAHVVCIGLGSLGSHVALSLAKAGVRRFSLFDPDILMPENVCRHVGDLTDLGRLKVEVVRDAVLRRRPDAEVNPIAASPLPDQSHEGTVGYAQFALALLDPNAVVIVTVADDRIERPLNALLVQAGVPVIFGSVLGPGTHGRIFRVRPAGGGCYECLLHAQAADAVNFPSLPAPQGTMLPATDGYRQPGIPGVGIDVEQVALMTARLTLQTILGDNATYPDATHEHHLWTNRGGWVFDRPLQVTSSDIPIVDGCRVCVDSGTSESVG